MEEELEKAFLLFFLFIPGRSLRLMYRKKELALCSMSSFKQKIKSAEGGT